MAIHLSFYEKDIQARFNELLSEAIYERSMRLYSIYDLSDMTIKFADEALTPVTLKYELFSTESMTTEKLIEKNKRQ